MEKSKGLFNPRVVLLEMTPVWGELNIDRRRCTRQDLCKRGAITIRYADRSSWVGLNDHQFLTPVYSVAL